MYTIVKPEDRLRLLCHFLKTHADKKVIVFTLACAVVDYLSKVRLPPRPSSCSTVCRF